MRILIATPLYPPDIGGPAKYAKGVREALDRQGHQTFVVSYTPLVRKLPIVLKHAVYTLFLIPEVLSADVIIALDTWLSGIPALILAKVFRKKFLVRVGGDIVWEWYVERTGEVVKLSEFYTVPRELSLKEKIIFWGTRVLMRRADALLFNSAWLADMYTRAYGLPGASVHILENEYAPRRELSESAPSPTFVAAHRRIRLKNMERLEQAFRGLKRTHPEIELDTRALPPDAHRARMARAYAVVVPSISEVSPNTVYEAVELGKPFICTEDTGLPEPFRKLGILIDTRDTQAFIQAIELLLDRETYRLQTERIARFSHSHTFGDIAREIVALAEKL